MPTEDVQKLLQWFERSKRALPWRDNPSPYRVWISEVMLQQTRACVVIEYFEKWMERYPSIEDLAKAPLDELIKLWEGLGYYNRVRNIHKAALYFIQHHGGEIPCDKESLLKVPGLGSYTVGAILSFAFQQKQPAVDGNVSRVMSRYQAFTDETSSSRARKKLEALTSDFLPEHQPHIIMEALIELGATICGKTPQCLRCPLQLGCKAHWLGIADSLPKTKKRRPITYLYKEVIVLRSGNEFLVSKQPLGKVLGGLYEFLSFDKEDGLDVNLLLKNKFDLDAYLIQELGVTDYTYTHHAVELFPSIWETLCKKSIPGYEWRGSEELFTLPFTSGHKRILSSLAKGEHL
ncbi:MAG: A/G-specific adenine glycosylase [Chlamydiia bacterium]|nr:A/G-specific adenine glycosylase [Chlamydiia bacterium]